MPGFVEFSTYGSPEGERVSVIVFDTWDHHEAWRDDPEHRRAQARGRQDFYQWYSIVVANERHHRTWSLH
jgi:heme-degrading monooxygenase HmoA